MSETKEAPKIYAAMAAVLADVKPVGKDGTNRDQGYKFRALEDVMSHVRAALVKHDVFYLPTVLQRMPETRTTRNGTPMNVVHLEIRYDFYAADGSTVSSVVWGEGADMADKATNKAMAQALKYNLVQAFSIAADDMQDADRETVEAGPRSAAEAFESASPPPQRQEPPTEPDADAQPFADEAFEARTTETLKAIKTKAREAHKLTSVIRNPSTGGLGGLGQYISWRERQVAKEERAYADLKAAAAEAGISDDEELEHRLVAACGKGVEEASAEDMEKAAALIRKGAEPATGEGSA